VKNDALFVSAMAALAVTVRLPDAWLRSAGRFLGASAHALAPGLRRTAEENVARAFPELDARARAALVRRVYVRLGEQLGEAVASLDPVRQVAPLPFAPGARAVLDDALGEGRGVVFASAHLGPWERVAKTLVDAGFPFTAVAREAYDPRLDAVYTRLRTGRGVRTIYRGRPGAPAALLRVLRAGGLLGIPMDLASRVPSVDVPFLGVLAPTPVGPAKLALRTGAAVVVGAAALDDGRLVVDVTPVRTADLTGRGVSRQARDDAARLLTARINDALSARIRAMPEAWPWMHARFPEPV
jgi:KDO2-lipid IV(A) lauroyltransferase